MWLSLMTFSKLPEMQSSSAIPTSLRTQNGGEVTYRLGANTRRRGGATPALTLASSKASLSGGKTKEKNVLGFDSRGGACS